MSLCGSFSKKLEEAESEVKPEMWAFHPTVNDNFFAGYLKDLSLNFITVTQNCIWLLKCF